MSAVRTAVIATPAEPGAAWAQQVRDLEAAGWATLLLPDTLWTASPFPALASAAAVTVRLRLRTWVAAAPLRTPGVLVREASALQLLSGGRFELGIGAGRPEAKGEAERLGATWGSAVERIEQVTAAVRAVRSAVSPRPPVAVAAGGNRMLQAAVDLVTGPEDRIALAVGPLATVEELAAAAQRVHDLAGRRVRLTHQVSGIGDVVPAWLARGGLSGALLRDRGAAGWFPGDDPEASAAVLVQRADEFGIDEVVVPAELAGLFQPVLARLDAVGQSGPVGH